MKSKIYIHTAGERNIRLDEVDDPVTWIAEVAKAGGLWNAGSFFPYHALLQFDVELHSKTD